MYNTFGRFIAIGILVSIFTSSCKKDKEVTVQTPTGSRNELTKDSIFLYAKEVYLWNDALPTYDAFNPRSYNSSSSHFSNLEKELFAITRFGINPATGKPYEFNPDSPSDPKYSYIEDLVASGKISYVNAATANLDISTGRGNDFGIGNVGGLSLGSNKYAVVFGEIYPNSPLAVKGIGRGDYFTSLNGRDISAFSDSDITFINNFLNNQTATSMRIVGKKKGGADFDITVTKSVYTIKPIIKDTVLTSGGKKIGYYHYVAFTAPSNSESVLTDVFSKFSSQGVTDIIIDLRYNGGGFVSSAEHMINLIVPSSQNGKVMFVENYNETMQNGKATILKNQAVRDADGKTQFFNGRVLNYFDYDYSKAKQTTSIAKKGSLNNISKVVFITSDGSASSSELVINSLKPYMDVKIVGDTTYGKPVGFFPIRIDKFDLYLSMFSTVNSKGEGFYFAGMLPDKIQSDDKTRDFGDPNEKCIASAISYIVNNMFTNSTGSQKISTTKSTPQVVKTMVDDSEAKFKQSERFNGMIARPKK